MIGGGSVREGGMKIILPKGNGVVRGEVSPSVLRFEQVGGSREVV